MPVRDANSHPNLRCLRPPHSLISFLISFYSWWIDGLLVIGLHSHCSHPLFLVRYTALHLAYDHGRELEPELFQMLIEACPSAAKAKTRFDGLLPLHVGAYLNVSAAATIALLEAFPDGPNEPDSKGSTPLYYALQDPDGPEVNRISLPFHMRHCVRK
jgi:hypothetical protein